MHLVVAGLHKPNETKRSHATGVSMPSRRSAAGILLLIYQCCAGQLLPRAMLLAKYR